MFRNTNIEYCAFNVRTSNYGSLNCLCHVFSLNTSGIPSNDLKEHERNRSGSRSSIGSGSDDDDEPVAKKSKPEGLLGTAPNVMTSVPGMVPAGMLPPHGIPGMPPGIPMGHMMQMGPMGPQFMHPG